MDSAIRENARRAVKRILEAASYDVEEVGEPLDLSAVGRDHALVVLCSDDPDEAEQFDTTSYRLRIGDETMECKKLLVTLSDSVRTTACTAWGASEFMRYAGEATLAGVLGREFALSFAPVRELVAERSGVPEQAPASGVDEEALEGPEILHLPLQVSEKRAIGIAHIQGSTRCRFIPHWFYHCMSTGERQIKDRVINFDADEKGALNAINGIKAQLDIAKAELSPVSYDADVLSPKVAKQQAEEQLRGELVDQLTQKVRFKTAKGDAIFYEEKIIRPDRSGIAIDLTLVYVPVWQVRGGSRIVEVNAFTGEILSMPMDEGVELL